MGVARIMVRGTLLGVGLVRGPGAAPQDAGEFSKKKIAKMLSFSIFFKTVANHALIFRAFGRKTQIVGNL